MAYELLVSVPVSANAGDVFAANGNGGGAWEPCPAGANGLNADELVPAYVRTAAEAVAQKALGITGASTGEGAPAYTNQIPISTDADNTVFNGVGFKTGYRLNSSGAVVAASGITASGFIPCHVNDVIRLSGINYNHVNGNFSYCYMAFYDSGKTKIQSQNGSNIYSYFPTATWNADGSLAQITLTSTAYDVSNVAYIRISAITMDADSIITVNEEIANLPAIDVAPYHMAFVSDIHYDAGTYAVNALTHIGQALNIIDDRTALDAIVIGGDLAGGGSTASAALTMAQMTAVRGSLADALRGRSPLWIGGNHDTNGAASGAGNGARLTKSQLWSRIWRANNSPQSVLANIPIPLYGYRDDECQKIRLVWLDTEDNLDWGGGGANYIDAHNLGAEQLQWVCDTALDFSGKADATEWGVIFVSHVPFDWYVWTYTDENSATHSASVRNIDTVLAAYKNGTSLSITHNAKTVTKDFSSLSAKASILCAVAGHKHAFVSSTLTNSGVLQIGCPNACFTRNNESAYTQDADIGGTAHGTTAQTKTAGTANDTAFTVVTVDRANGKVYAWCYGAGYDRAWEV